jgi:hypothetical protein
MFEEGVIMPSQFNTLVQGLNIEDITPQQILAAGKPIFLDITTSSDINSINTLIQSWSRIHAPTFGQPIPGSGKLFSRINTGSIIAASGNEVRLVLSVSYTNAGAAPVTLDLALDNIVIQSNVAIGPAETQVAVIPEHLFVDSVLTPLRVTVLTGDGALLSTSALSILVVQ